MSSYIREIFEEEEKTKEDDFKHFKLNIEKRIGRKVLEIFDLCKMIDNERRKL